MHIRFLGGAGEVGASAILVTSNSGRNILLDAGVRVNEEGTEMLPNLEPLNSVSLDAIIISHAHLDHSGALPLVAKVSPGAGIYATAATKDLAKVLLYDSIKVAEFREGLQLFDADDAEQALDRMVTYGFEAAFEPAPGVLAMFLPAGHILGAAAVLLQTEEGTLLYTGDFTTFEQETVGMQRFTGMLKRGVDVAVVEATYGSRIHAPRSHELRRLLDAIGEVMADGGRVLIPAFAVGRAQELVLSLRNYIRRTKKKFPVYVDGLIRNVNAVFAHNPRYLADRYRKEALRGEELFYTNGIEAVTTKAQRDKILASSEPCVIIASSGMLTGGVSPVYAERIVGGRKNLLAIVGYQDEESPGRRLLDLAGRTEGERVIRLGDAEYQVRCRVARFGLSAHADSLGIAASIKPLAPRLVLVNHGNDESLEAMSEALASQLPEADVRVAIPGQVYEYAADRGVSAEGRRVADANGEADGGRVTAGRPRKYSLNPKLREISMHRDDAVVPEILWNHLLENDVGGTTVMVADLLEAWFGRGVENLPDEDKQAFRKAVRDSRYFRTMGTNPNAAYVLTDDEYNEAITPKQMEQNAAYALIQERLSKFGLQRIGFASGLDGTVTLYFPTPKYAIRCPDIIEQLERQMLRNVEVAQSSNMEFLKTKIRSELADEFGIRLMRDPSFGPQTVTVRTAAGADQPGVRMRTLGEYAQAFEAETGFKLRFRSDGGAARGPLQPLQTVRTLPAARDVQCHVRVEQTEQVRHPWQAQQSQQLQKPEQLQRPDRVQQSEQLKQPDGVQRTELLEQNAARQVIDEAFAGNPDRPKVSIYSSEGRMVLSFITPQVGARYRSLMDDLERITGWRLEVHESSRINELADLARQLLWGSKLGDMKVGVHSGYAEARGSLNVEEAVAADLNRRYLELTGYELRFRRT
ncbi:MAG: MBL fold metallo-hydrolase [Firmicutes bacterium]|nr:MBL fold metallo-hydrolase [Bacillota bacterium]